MSDISVGLHFATTSIAHLNLWLNMLVFELHLGDTGAGTGFDKGEESLLSHCFRYSFKNCPSKVRQSYRSAKLNGTLRAPSWHCQAFGLVLQSSVVIQL